MQICPACGRSFKEETGGLYCPYDGHALMRPQLIICHTCGGETDAEGRYCVRCGALLVSPPDRHIRNFKTWLAQSWRLYSANFLTIAAVLLVADLPYCLAFQYWWRHVDTSTPQFGILALDVAAGLVIGALITPAIILQLTAHWRGEKLTIGELCERAFKVWSRLLWNRLKVILLVSLGIILLVIPGIVLLVRYAFVDYVVALEKNTRRSPLAISKQVGENFRWKILGYYLFSFLIYVAAEAVLFWGLFTKNPELTWWVYAIKQVIADMVLEFSTVSLFVLYWGLRAIKAIPDQERSTPVDSWTWNPN